MFDLVWFQQPTTIQGQTCLERHPSGTTSVAGSLSVGAAERMWTGGPAGCPSLLSVNHSYHAPESEAPLRKGCGAGHGSFIRHSHHLRLQDSRGADVTQTFTIARRTRTVEGVKVGLGASTKEAISSSWLEGLGDFEEETVFESVVER